MGTSFKLCATKFTSEAFNDASADIHEGCSNSQVGFVTVECTGCTLHLTSAQKPNKEDTSDQPSNDTDGHIFGSHDGAGGYICP